MGLGVIPYTADLTCTLPVMVPSFAPFWTECFLSMVDRETFGVFEADIILIMSLCGGPTNPEPASNTTGRKVFCQKFQKEMPGLDAPPWPGELGQRVYENISVEAWKMWEERMKMILNEYRLMPWQKEAQQLVTKHMEDFFFGEGAALPPGYVPQQSKG